MESSEYEKILQTIDEMPKAKISKLCLAGFIMSSIGAVSFFGFVFLGAYRVESYEVELAVTFFIVVELLIAFIVSVKGVVSASLNRYRFRFLGVFGILLSGIPLTIAMHYLPLLIFHESPPSPPPTYSQTG